MNNKKTENEIIEERLQFILSSTNDWLKFAETKNGAVLVFDGAAVFAILTFILNQPLLIHVALVIYFYSLIVFFSLAILACLMSFIPRTKISWIVDPKAISDHDNFIFFSDCAKYLPDEFLKYLYVHSNLDFDLHKPIEKDYAEQIIVNSRIASRKYSFFRFAVWLTILGIATPIGAGLIYLINKGFQK